MNKTKIDWCDMSWNPVTGCLHGCPYCYARNQSRRFGGWNYSCGMVRINVADDKTHIALTTDNFRGWGCKVYEFDGHKIAELENAYLIERSHKTMKAPYPFGFMPTLHRYRLDQPASKRKPQTIFVGSMTDLFGAWVPEEWIEEVIEACAAAPQHRQSFTILAKIQQSKRQRDWQKNIPGRSFTCWSRLVCPSELTLLLPILQAVGCRFRRYGL